MKTGGTIVAGGDDQELSDRHASAVAFLFCLVLGIRSPIVLSFGAEVIF
jgi:hypothetical protein